MDELILYLTSALYSEDLALSEEMQEVCAGIISTAVPLMVLAVILGLFCLCIMAAFNFLRGRRRDL